jgi:predicted amidohydrolase YtcJ
VTIKRILFFLAAALALSITVASARKPIPIADTIIARGKVYTGNKEQPWATAVAIRDGKIMAVGDEETIYKLHSATTEVIEAGGHLVLPGFVDCHIHFWMAR